MIVNIILHSILRDRLPAEAKGRSQMELSQGSRIQDVIAGLQLPEPVLCSLNGVLTRDHTTPLNDKDELRFFRPGLGDNFLLDNK